MPSRPALSEPKPQTKVITYTQRVCLFCEEIGKVFASPAASQIGWPGRSGRRFRNSNSAVWPRPRGEGEAKPQAENTSFMQFAILATQHHLLVLSAFPASPLAAVVGFASDLLFFFFIKSNFALSLAWPFNKFRQALHFQQFFLGKTFLQPRLAAVSYFFSSFLPAGRAGWFGCSLCWF